MGLPSLREVTDRETTPTPLGLSDTVIATLATMAAMDNPVTVHASVQLLGTNGAGSVAQGVSLKLFRNGVEISGSDRYAQTINDGNTVVGTMSAHWTDETPGKNPVYVLKALCTSTTIEVINRRLTGRI